VAPRKRVRPRIRAKAPASRGRRVRTAACDNGRVAEEIGLAALELAKRASAAGLSRLVFLLESAALEAGAEALARRWPAEAAEP